MEQITRIAGVICISVMIMGILYEMGAFPATEKAIRFVIAIYIMLTVFTTVSDTKLQLDYGRYRRETDTQHSTQQLTQQLAQQTGTELEKIIENRLKQKNISYNSISVHILEQNGVLYADSINVQCPQRYTAQVLECISDIATEKTRVTTGE